MRLSIAITLALVTVAAPQKGSAAEMTTGLIVGTVEETSGSPIAKATVSAASSSGHYSVLTDTRGGFAILNVAPDTYVVTVDVSAYQSATIRSLRVFAGQQQRISFSLEKALRVISSVRSRSMAFSVGSSIDTFRVIGAAARANVPTTASAGLASYTAGTVQGAIANVPGVDFDPFANAILRGGRVNDAVFDYDSVPIPQGLIVEPGGNVAGAQLPTTGVASTNVTLAGYSNENDNALGGVINQIPAVGFYPGSTTVEIGEGLGTLNRVSNIQILDATRDLKWRYAFASSLGTEHFQYGDGRFYPAEAATYGLGLENRSYYSVESNVHYRATPRDDLSILGLFGQAEYGQYGSPFAGETVGQFDGTMTKYPGETNPDEPVSSISGVRGNYDVIKAEWQHTTPNVLYRLQLYQSRVGSTAGGPFWDENGFPDGSISLFETASYRQYGVNFDTVGVFGRNRIGFGATYRTEASALNEVVPTADEYIRSDPTIGSYLIYLGDTWNPSERLEVMGTARFTESRIKPSTGFAYDTAALDPHLGLSYRLASNYALRVNFDRVSVAPAPLEADRTDSANVEHDGTPAPFVALTPETANDFTYSLEGNGRIAFRLTYYRKLETNLIDVLPFNFRSSIAAGLNPTGLGVPTNVGQLDANGVELYVKAGTFGLTANYVRAFSSSASQFAYNDLNAPAVAANHLFPVGYEPDFTSELSYEFSPARNIRVTPSLSYSTGYPYGNGRMVYVFDPTTRKPMLVPNDNHVNPGANYYFLKNPVQPFNAISNPYIGDLGTNEGSDPNSLRSPPEVFVNLHMETDVTPRLTALLSVSNLLGNFSPTAYQSNPYLIGPPGYAGGNTEYARYYQTLIGASHPYVLGNGVPTNDGFTQAVPWMYGRTGYVPQSYPLGRTWQISLRYHF